MPGRRLMGSRPAGTLAPERSPAGRGTRGCAAQTPRPDFPGERPAAAAGPKSAEPGKPLRQGERGSFLVGSSRCYVAV